MHDVGSWHGQIFMVMELVDGEPLSELARRGIPPAEALRLVADAAEALAAAHEREILHRDIKGDNLMRTHDGRIKVLDFGLAKLRAQPEGGRDGCADGVARRRGRRDPRRRRSRRRSPRRWTPGRSRHAAVRRRVGPPTNPEALLALHGGADARTCFRRCRRRRRRRA